MHGLERLASGRSKFGECIEDSENPHPVETFCGVDDANIAPESRTATEAAVCNAMLRRAAVGGSVCAIDVSAFGRVAMRVGAAAAGGSTGCVSVDASTRGTRVTVDVARVAVAAVL